MAMAIAAILFFCLLTLSSNSKADQGGGFDVRQHLSTVTRYGAVKDIVDNSFIPSHIPDGCTPIHLNLVARHGTRSPTKKRLREMEKLADHVQELIKDVKDKELSLRKVPAWLQTWDSPWRGKLKGGELDSKGEEELYQLGIRVRERFPEIFNEEYHPDVYPIKATQ
ncbi:Histidine phosphatase superfamily, clade-2, partial [Corchorus capsularis]